MVLRGGDTLAQYGTVTANGARFAGTDTLFGATRHAQYKHSVLRGARY